MTTLAPVRETPETLAPLTPSDAQVLRRAASLLETVGWCQGMIACDDEGNAAPLGHASVRGYCIGGAIDQASIELRWQLDSYTDESFWEYWGAILEHPVALFNDHPWRTVEEVTGLLRETADRLDAEEKEACGA